MRANPFFFFTAAIVFEIESMREGKCTVFKTKLRRMGESGAARFSLHLQSLSVGTLMPVSHYRESPADPLRITLELEHKPMPVSHYVDQNPRGSPVDPHKIPQVYALTPGGS